MPKLALAVLSVLMPLAVGAVSANHAHPTAVGFAESGDAEKMTERIGHRHVSCQMRRNVAMEKMSRKVPESLFSGGIFSQNFPTCPT